MFCLFLITSFKYYTLFRVGLCYFARATISMAHFIMSFNLKFEFQIRRISQVARTHQAEERLGRGHGSPSDVPEVRLGDVRPEESGHEVRRHPH